MSYIVQNEKLIQNEMTKLKNKVTLKLFTDFKTEENGTKIRNCMACDSTFNLLNTLKEHSDGKLEVEEYSTQENSDIADKYEVVRIPTILFIDEKDREVIRYTAEPSGAELVPFIKSIQDFSGAVSFYKDTIMTNLKKIGKSEIKLFITHTCPYCPTVVPIANLFATLSDGKIKVNIIDINANQDIAMKYQIQGVPHTMINEKEHIYGMFSPQDLLEKLTKGKRDFDGMYA
ncbi:MAG: thioredoxin family protein [Promethearchaeota archaeon]